MPFIGTIRGTTEFVDVDTDGDMDVFISGFGADEISQTKLYKNGLFTTSLSASFVFSSKVYPNPFDEQINLTFENHIGEITIELSNLLGQVVLTKEINSASDTRIETKYLQSGLYFLNMKSKNGKSKTISILKE